jgi:hypothetical protein
MVELLIEGRPGSGAGFMVGTTGPTALPPFVTDAVTLAWQRAFAAFGPVRFEWVCDARGQLWIVQLHVGKSESRGEVIYPGERDHWHRYDVAAGLEGLRDLLRTHKDFPHHSGIVLVGNVGVTSHFGDLLRRARIPSRIERPAEQKTA